MKNPTQGMLNTLVSIILCNLELKDLDFDAVQAAVGAPKKLAKVIAEAVNKNFAKAEPPRTSRLTKSFVVEVDYDDPDNLVIPELGGEVCYIDSALKLKHFPIRGKGKVKRTFRYLEFDYQPTIQEILDATKEHKAQNPDLADTKAFHKANTGERDIAPVLSLCGEFEDHGNGRYVANVYADDDGLHFSFCRLQDPWRQRIRVLVLSE